MKTIWKYELNHEINMLDIPEGFKILSVEEQFNKIIMYCLVNPDHLKEKARIYMVGTGWEITDDFFSETVRFIGTVKTFNGTYMWHVFHSLN